MPTLETVYKCNSCASPHEQESDIRECPLCGKEMCLTCAFSIKGVLRCIGVTNPVVGYVESFLRSNGLRFDGYSCMACVSEIQEAAECFLGGLVSDVSKELKDLHAGISYGKIYIYGEEEICTICGEVHNSGKGSLEEAFRLRGFSFSVFLEAALSIPRVTPPDTFNTCPTCLERLIPILDRGQKGFVAGVSDKILHLASSS